MKRERLVWIALVVVLLAAFAVTASAGHEVNWINIAPGTVQHVHCTSGDIAIASISDNTIAQYCDTGPTVAGPSRVR